MVLATGKCIGPYEIVAPLGAGGMGEVYRAHDPRLGREVAIKVLREGVGDRRRFEAEARAASSLNHPNIITVYDIGEEDGAPYIVFELLEGDSLRAEVAAGPLPVRKLLDCAVQIADGLAAAHARNITHRDLKPENIMVLHDGQVKILDFGLAKSPVPPADDNDTRTVEGMLLGTLAYMSPEQAQGHTVDFRSDQFSFGAILYEMATGAPAFRRSDRVSILNAIVREEPGPLSGEACVPAPVRWVIERCLAKDPSQRYASTADLYHQLRDLRDHVSDLFARDAALASIAPRARYRKRLLLAAAAVALVAAGVIAGTSLVGGHTNPPSYRYTPFAVEAADETGPAWSADGKALAYTSVVNGVAQVFARRLDSLMPAQVTSAPANCMHPFWSADGARIYYWSASTVWSVASVGGEPSAVVHDVTTAFPAASLAPDGRTLAFFRSDGPQQTVQLMALANGHTTAYQRSPFPARFRLAGGLRFAPGGRKLLVSLTRDIELGSELWILPYPSGMPRRVESELLSGYRHVTASWMPDDRHIALATAPALGAGSHIYVLDTETGANQPLTTGTGEESEPAISPDGDRMAFATGTAASNLMEATLDGSAIMPLLVTPRHQHSADWAPSGMQFAYVSDASGPPEIWLRSITEAWAVPVVRDSPEGDLGHATPRFSPDGQKLAYVRVGAKHVIWISNLSGGVASPLEQESPDQHAPAWSPDGQWLAYVRYSGSQWEIAKAPAGGGARPVRIALGGNAASKLEWSPSGEWIAFSEGDELRAVSPSGGAAGLLAKGAATFTFARDGASVYLVRRGSTHKWELVARSVPGGVESRPVMLNLPQEAIVTSARLHPDGKRLVLSVSTWNRDIWILHGLGQRGGLLWSELFTRFRQ